MTDNSKDNRSSLHSFDTLSCIFVVSVMVPKNER